MDEREIRALLERHWTDIENQAIVHEIYHDDIVVEFPQSNLRNTSAMLTPSILFR